MGEQATILGTMVRDTITGFEGMAIARMVYLNGNVQVHVQSAMMNNGVPVEAQWIDEYRLIPAPEGKSGAFGGAGSK